LAVKITKAHMDEQRSYHRLCAAAEACGIPTSLDDPRSPRTVLALTRAVQGAKDGAYA